MGTADAGGLLLVIASRTMPACDNDPGDNSLIPVVH